MTAESRKVSACPTLNSVPANTTVLVVATVNAVANNYQVLHQGIVLGSINTPANSTALATVVKDSIAWDANFFYVATANGHLKRSSLSDF